MKIDEKWLQEEIRNSVLRESYRRELILDESFAVGLGKIADKLSKLPGGKYVFGVLKEYLFSRVCQRFNIKKNETMGQFISAAFKRLNYETLAKIHKNELTCDEAIEVLTQVCSDVLTKKLVKSILIYLIQHYDIEDIVNNAISFDLDLLGQPGSVSARRSGYIPGDSQVAVTKGAGAESVGDILSQEFLGKEFSGSTSALMSRNQAENLLNSFVGIVGQQFLEELVLKFVTSRLIPPIADIFCDKTEGESTLPDEHHLEDKLEKTQNITGNLDSLISTAAGAL
jgi:hypothetical protein